MAKEEKTKSEIISFLLLSVVAVALVVVVGFIVYIIVGYIGWLITDPLNIINS